MSAVRAPWSPEELLLLEELSIRNVSLQVIALKLGRTMAAVMAKASQQRIPVRTRSPLTRATPAFGTHFLAGER
jgi:hypothetical protein